MNFLVEIFFTQYKNCTQVLKTVFCSARRVKVTDVVPAGEISRINLEANNYCYSTISINKMVIELARILSNMSNTKDLV